MLKAEPRVFPLTVQPPQFDDPGELRTYRKQQLAVAYRWLGQKGFEEQGAGHISARDPERTDAFWLVRRNVPFTDVRVSDLVLVGPDGTVLEGDGIINMTAYNIHMPIHDARPAVTAVAHLHSHYGVVWSAMMRPIEPITQEACVFYDDHVVFEGEDVLVETREQGEPIAEALGGAKAVLLRNHGLLTVGETVAEAAAWFLQLERVCQVHVDAYSVGQPALLSHETAVRTRGSIGTPSEAWHQFQPYFHKIIADQPEVLT